MSAEPDTVPSDNPSMPGNGWTYIGDMPVTAEQCGKDASFHSYYRLKDGRMELFQREVME